MKQHTRYTDSGKTGAQLLQRSASSTLLCPLNALL